MSINKNFPTNTANSNFALSTASAVLALALTGTMTVQAQETAVEPLTAAKAPADLILKNGQVKTPASWSQAIAIKNGVILKVGTTEELKPYQGSKTRVIDLHGETVLPGFFDSHVHPLYGGLVQKQCRVAQGLNLDQALEKIRQCTDAVKSGEWVIGGQWDASALGTVPNRTILDKVSGNHPVLLDDTSGHSSWANSKALELAGITNATPNPTGGIIERDAAGVATGVLREAAIEVVRSHVPAPSQNDVKAALTWSLNTMLSYGITSFTEAAVGFPAGPDLELNMYDQLADAGVLKQRVRLCMTWDQNSELSNKVIAARNLYARNLVAPDCVKIFLDGVPTDGHTAAMLHPYETAMEGRDDDASRLGMLMVKQDVLSAAVTKFDAMGLAVKFHSAGDAAVRAGLNAIEAARKANGYSGKLHDIGHSTLVDKEDLDRARLIGATFEVSPYLWSPSPINNDITHAVGNDRADRAWPIKEMLDAHALVVAGSDWAVIPSVNPWIGVESLVTREEPGGSANSFGKKEAISLEEAIELFTANSARDRGMGNVVGRIEVGMLADLIVLNQNPFQVPVNQIHNTLVNLTLIDGKVAFDRNEKVKNTKPVSIRNRF